MNRDEILGLIIVGSTLLACAILFTLFVIDTFNHMREKRIASKEQVQQVMGALEELRAIQDRILERLKQ